MDGFDENTGVLVLAATNRPDVLDSALTRPGRFDRKIMIDKPDYNSRVLILKVHSKDKKIDEDVDFETISKKIIGFTGADISNLMNEAAILSARDNKETISQEYILKALDKITIGLPKDSIITAEKRRLVAYHEAGHAVVGKLLRNYDNVSKISIVARGATGGVTHFLPNEEHLDSGLYTKRYLEDKVCVAFGGRVAEEIKFGKDEITTGAASDIQQITNIVKEMVLKLGFGTMTPFVWKDDEQYFGENIFSQEILQKINKDIEDIIDTCYKRTKNILLNNERLLDDVTDALLEKEEIDGKELDNIVKNYSEKKLF